MTDPLRQPADWTRGATCNQCDLPIHLTLPFHIGPTRATPTALEAPVTVDQQALEQAVRLHLDHCGTTP